MVTTIIQNYSGCHGNDYNTVAMISLMLPYYSINRTTVVVMVTTLSYYSINRTTVVVIVTTIIQNYSCCHGNDYNTRTTVVVMVTTIMQLLT